MTELSALAGSEGYAACDDDGDLYCPKRLLRAFLDSLPPQAGSSSFMTFRALSVLGKPM